MLPPFLCLTMSMGDGDEARRAANVYPTRISPGTVAEARRADVKTTPVEHNSAEAGVRDTTLLFLSEIRQYCRLAEPTSVW